MGIKKVYEREYGGIRDMFSRGNRQEPRFLPEKITESLGEIWKTENVRECESQAVRCDGCYAWGYRLRQEIARRAAGKDERAW